MSALRQFYFPLISNLIASSFGEGRPLANLYGCHLQLPIAHVPAPVPPLLARDRLSPLPRKTAAPANGLPKNFPLPNFTASHSNHSTYKFTIDIRPDLWHSLLCYLEQIFLTPAVAQPLTLDFTIICTLLNSLAPFLPAPVLCFQSFTASFCKTPRVGYPHP